MRYLLKSLHAGYIIAIVIAIEELPTGCLLNPVYRVTLLKTRNPLRLKRRTLLIVTQVLQEFSEIYSIYMVKFK